MLVTLYAVGQKSVYVTKRKAQEEKLDGWKAVTIKI